MKKNELKSTETKQIGKNTFIDVEIGLRYIENNGYSYFYATGEKYNLNGGIKNVFESGYIHDEIVKYFPEFKIFVNLHGNSSYGMPLHMLSDTKFAIDNNKIDAICRTLGISEEMAKEIICWGEEIDYIKYFLEENDIIYHLRSKANKAIKMLKELTGNEFDNPDILEIYDYIPLCKEVKDRIKNLHEKGYFIRDNVIKRRNEKIREIQLQKLESEKKKLESEKKEIDNEIQVLQYLFDRGIRIDCHAYLRSVNILAINLLKNGDGVMTEKEYKDFIDSIDYSKLPKNISFEFNKI
jgi:hypothetical protein